MGGKDEEVWYTFFSFAFSFVSSFAALRDCFCSCFVVNCSTGAVRARVSERVRKRDRERREGDQWGRVCGVVIIPLAGRATLSERERGVSETATSWVQPLEGGAYSLTLKTWRPRGGDEGDRGERESWRGKGERRFGEISRLCARRSRGQRLERVNRVIVSYRDCTRSESITGDTWQNSTRERCRAGV